MAAHGKMPKSQRAKQFMPFAALRGYELLVQEECAFKEERREVTPYRRQQISKVLEGLRKGDEVKITFYENGFYETHKGFLLEIEPVFQWLSLQLEKSDNNQEIKINFIDIWYLKRLNVL